ncbi:MAG: hypothetical protein QHJ73_01315, partial [Armatimonadota bacterium]|nr:hypothetical protein [Armatimonadota bacterium]
MKLALPAYGGAPLENELVARVSWFIHARWLVAAGLMVISAAAALWGAQTGALLLIAAAILGYNAVLQLGQRRLAGRATPAQWRLFAHLQILLDWCALAALSAATGGLESPLVLFFTVHVILAAMLLRRRECLAQTTVGVLLIAVMAHGSSPSSPIRIPQSS